jgi:hypothetical protein
LNPVYALFLYQKSGEEYKTKFFFEPPLRQWYIQKPMDRQTGRSRRQMAANQPEPGTGRTCGRQAVFSDL